MNIDYSICHGLSYNTTGLPGSLVIYDVGCQWSVNFQERHDESATLHLPPGLSWIAAVGKFHLGTHEQTCFAKFSLNFVQGAGQQDGEILETLWAPLNKIGSSIRAMSKSARQETVDDHMRDSNWKKLTKIGAVFSLLVVFPPHVCTVNSLGKKYSKAINEEKESRQVFEDLDSSIDNPTRQKWTKQEHLAMTKRGDFLQIYQAQLNPCQI
jgi:hypothetical protein